MALEALKRNGHNLELGLFSLDGPFGIPRLVPTHLNDRIPWIPFNCVMSDRQRESHGVHFFIDDYLFQRAWNDPCRYAHLLSGYQAVMTPDFSMFTDYPVTVQLYKWVATVNWGSYFELQYHGHLSINDVESVTFSDTLPGNFDVILGKLKRKGVKVYQVKGGSLHEF